MGTKLKDWSREYFSTYPKVIFVLMLFLICATIIIFDLRKEIVIMYDDKEIEVVTLAKDAQTILDDNEIILGSKDKISIDLNSEINDGDVIYIKTAVNTTLTVDGQTLDILTAEDTIGKMLEAESIQVNEFDKVEPSLNEEISEDMEISIKRIEKETVVEKEDIAFDKQVKNSSELAKGEKEVLQEGVPGEKVITTEVVYEDGVIIQETVLTEEVTKNPVDEILAMGTLDVLKTSRGTEYFYTNVINVTATAYTADLRPDGTPDDPYMGVTAVGTQCKRDPNGYSTIAVDPSVIPLGTKVYVEGYGLAIAEDVGGAIKGNKIDVFLNTYSETVSWGRKNLNVYILKGKKN